MIDEEKIREAVKLLLEGMGEDPEREGLIDTPDRVARMYKETMAGYDDDAKTHLSRVFSAENSEMVIVSDIVFHSTCEHHLMPFFGKVHIGYVPGECVVGISKLARTVEVFSRRLQIQERMTGQIADSIMEHLGAKGVIVVAEAEHTCMTMRGVKKPGSKTTTVATRGCLVDNESLKNDFYRNIK